MKFWEVEGVAGPEASQNQHYQSAQGDVEGSALCLSGAALLSLVG